METREIQEIRACLPRGRTKFYYAPDRYAHMLLAWAAEPEARVSHLREGRFGQLLHKPAIRKLLASAGGGIVTPELFHYAPASDWKCYTLSLSSWPEDESGRRDTWDQVSRTGKSLVLQLNFSNEHEQSYRRLYSDQEWEPFVGVFHPTRMDGRRTIAWSRMDIDLESGESLIEEVQSDWVRDVLWVEGEALGLGGTREGWERVQSRHDLDCKRDEFLRYAAFVRRYYLKVWPEAMLAASLWFLREELGVRRVYYHTPETHESLKRIRGTQPPRSLYTTLPKRFCFERVNDAPEFLGARRMRKMVKHEGLQLQRLDLFQE